jgi:ankyrin repeat protein
MTDVTPAVVKGADVSRSSNDGMKPIHYFARRALLPESVVSNEKGLDYLMKFGADINVPNKYGETPLHNAILQGNLLMVQLLLSKDPDLTLTNRYASTRSKLPHFPSRAL